MIAQELISDAIPPARTSDTIQKVYDRMREFRVSHLPIVNNNEFLGLISEDDFVEAPDFEFPIGGLSLSLINPFVYADQHIYDVIRQFSELKLTVVPVLDQKRTYLGLVSINSMVEHMANITSVKEQGAILVLEIGNRENSMSHIAQIIESENVQILSSYIKHFTDSTRMELTLKLNRTDVAGIVASLLRYDYTVKATFSDQRSDDDSQDRFDSFMNYLNV